MGMGEPLHNYDATMKALRILADEHGFGDVGPAHHALDGRRAARAGAPRDRTLMPNLAISLHSTTEEQRDCWCRSTGSTG